jgi:WD40 repeat protein
MHPIQKKFAATFDDGYIHFFDLEQLKTFGKVRISSDKSAISALSFAKTGDSFIAGDMNGGLYFVSIRSWNPLVISSQQVGIIILSK